MKPAFHYTVKAKLIRYKNANEINFLEVNEPFENENPILARDAAFNFYQNYLDVLLQAKGNNYQSDNQAREDLKTFIDIETVAKIKVGSVEFDMSDSIGNGIGIYFVVDIPKEENFIALSDSSQDEFLIHGIGNFVGKTDPDAIISNLEHEFDYYKNFNYDTKNKEKEVIFCSQDEWEDGYRENEPSAYSILETPFDWNGYDKPYWWGDPHDEINGTQETRRSIEEIIDEGEGNQVEFKPTLLYNFKTKQGGIGIKSIIAKTICAFLNSNGGLLFIGVDDNGQIQGLDFDFSLANGKKPKDFFLLEFDDMIKQFIGFAVKPLVNGHIYETDEKAIFIVEVEPSINRPIFLKGQDNSKEFWVRGNASNRQLTDIEEILNYMLNRQIK